MPAAAFSSTCHPCEIAVGLRKPVLVAQGVGQARLRHVLPVGQNDVVLDGRQLVLQRLEQRHEGQIDENRLILGMVDDIDDLIRKEPRIDRVIDRPVAHNAVEHLDVGARCSRRASQRARPSPAPCS